jgi:rhamnosyltransferase
MNNNRIVILASYNPEEFIIEQIDSIRNQNISTIAIYDDASSPSQLQFLESVIEKHQKQIELLKRRNNVGVVKNFIEAIEDNAEAFDQFFLSDQDDIWLPNKVEMVSSALNYHKKPTLVYHDAQIINEKGKILYPSFWEFLNQGHYEHRLDTFLYGNFVTGGACAFNRALAPYIIRMPEGLHSLHDAWVALCGFCFGQVVKINEKLNLYRMHQNNVALTRKVPLTRIEKFSNAISHLFDTNFLSEELELAEAFMNTFKNEIPNEQRRTLEAFVLLKRKPSFMKMLHKRKTLKKYSASRS